MRISFVFVTILVLKQLHLGALCTGEKGIGQSGKKLSYEGSNFHRVIKGYVAAYVRHVLRMLMTALALVS